MRIGNFKYSLVLKKEPCLDRLYKELRELLDSKGYESSDFSVSGDKFICDSMRALIYYGDEEPLKQDLIKIGNKYGIERLSFPYWYYPK